MRLRSTNDAARVRGRRAAVAQVPARRDRPERDLVLVRDPHDRPAPARRSRARRPRMRALLGLAPERRVRVAIEVQVLVGREHPVAADRVREFLERGARSRARRCRGYGHGRLPEKPHQWRTAGSLSSARGPETTGSASAVARRTAVRRLHLPRRARIHNLPKCGTLCYMMRREVSQWTRDTTNATRGVASGDRYRSWRGRRRILRGAAYSRSQAGIPDSHHNRVDLRAAEASRAQHERRRRARHSSHGGRRNERRSTCRRAVRNAPNRDAVDRCSRALGSGTRAFALDVLLARYAELDPAEASRPPRSSMCRRHRWRRCTTPG